MKLIDRSVFMSLALILLLLFQMNALPIHEFNLRQQGYTLVNVEPWSVGSAEPATITQHDKNFYNIALCNTHLQINLLQQFQELLGAILLAFAVFISFDFLSFFASLFRKDYFLSSLSSRAPPLYR